jgi:ribonucleoside-diphosphate reductase beta chain
MSILEGRDYYKPFQYPWAFEYYKEQNHAHWLLDEVNLADDSRDFNEKLTDKQRLLIRNILLFFTQADSNVQGGYSQHYIPMFKPPEIQMMTGAFNNWEGIHKEAYSGLVDTLGMPEDTYQMFTKYKAMMDKHEYLANFGTATLHDLAKTMAVFSAFTEGVQLFGSFAILMNFQRHKLMKGTGQIVTWSIRDESLHVEGMTKLFRTLIEENPELWDDELKYEIYTAAERVVELEDAFIDTVFENAELPDLTAEEVKLYIRFLADRRLQALGLKPIFDSEPEDYPDWLQSLLSGVEHTNFFENRSTEYTRASTTGSWSDVFG